MRASFLPVVLLLTACFDYRETPPASVAPATEVRVELSDQGTVALAKALGPSVSRIEGTVREANADRLVISIANLSRRGAGTVDWSGEQVTLAPSDIRTVGVRALNSQKSWLAGGGLTAAVVVGIVAIAKATGIASGNPGTKPGNLPLAAWHGRF